MKQATLGPTVKADGGAGPENPPWEGEDEPWKNAEYLHLALVEWDMYQKDVAESMGTTSSTVGYWKNKLFQSADGHGADRDGYREEPCQGCGADTGDNALICRNCIDAIRAGEMEAI